MEVPKNASYNPSPADAHAALAGPSTVVIGTAQPAEAVKPKKKVVGKPALPKEPGELNVLATALLVNMNISLKGMDGLPAHLAGLKEVTYTPQEDGIALDPQVLSFYDPLFRRKASTTRGFLVDVIRIAYAQLAEVNSMNVALLGGSTQSKEYLSTMLETIVKNIVEQVPFGMEHALVEEYLPVPGGEEGETYASSVLKVADLCSVTGWISKTPPSEGTATGRLYLVVQVSFESGIMYEKEDTLKGLSSLVSLGSALRKEESTPFLAACTMQATCLSMPKFYDLFGMAIETTNEKLGFTVYGRAELTDAAEPFSNGWSPSAEIAASHLFNNGQGDLLLIKNC